MSIYSNNLGICLVTEFIEEKINEIPTGPKLLYLLNLENIIVTFDALNTQEKTIDTIVNQKGDAVAAVKSNQENTYEDLVNYFDKGEKISDVTYREKIEMCFHHLDYLLKIKCEKVSVLEMRSHIAWYIKGLPDCIEVKKECFKATTALELRKILENYLIKLDNGI